MKNMQSEYASLHICIAFVILLMIPNIVKAQDTENTNMKGDFRSKLFFGGGFGLQFGSVTLVEISPLAGYKITPKLSAGISPTYKYYKYNAYYGNVKTNVFGGSIFARYSIFENVFAHVEYESLFFNTKEPAQSTYVQQFNSFFVGGGYNQRIGGNSGMFILLLWNLNNTDDSPYSNPIIRLGFSVGL
jgi:hypothetical protein